MEKEIEFYIDGVKNGSATLFIENGEMDITDAESQFYKVLRHDRQDLIQEELEYIIDNLTNDQEEKLKAAHFKDYHGDKEHYEDSYNNWFSDLSLDELKAILETNA